MLLRFIGEDGSMGLKNAEVYKCSVCTSGGYFWVHWTNYGGVVSGCPYKSFKNLFENWEEV